MSGQDVTSNTFFGSVKSLVESSICYCGVAFQPQKVLKVIKAIYFLRFVIDLSWPFWRCYRFVTDLLTKGIQKVLDVISGLYTFESVGWKIAYNTFCIFLATVTNRRKYSFFERAKTLSNKMLDVKSIQGFTDLSESCKTFVIKLSVRYMKTIEKKKITVFRYGRTWTYGHQVKSPMLYLLSYAPYYHRIFHKNNKYIIDY